MGDRHTSGLKAVKKALRSSFRQRQAPSSSQVIFVADRFWYQVLYFAVGGKMCVKLCCNIRNVKSNYLKCVPSNSQCYFYHETSTA